MSARLYLSHDLDHGRAYGFTEEDAAAVRRSHACRSYALMCNGCGKIVVAPKWETPEGWAITKPTARQIRQRFCPDCKPFGGVGL